MQLTTTHGADSALFIRYTCMQLKAVPSQQLGASCLCEALLWVFADIVSEMYKFISLVIWALFFVVCAMLERRPSSIQSPHLCKWDWRVLFSWKTKGSRPLLGKYPPSSRVLIHWTLDSCWDQQSMTLLNVSSSHLFCRGRCQEMAMFVSLNSNVVRLFSGYPWLEQ